MVKRKIRRSFQETEITFGQGKTPSKDWLLQINQLPNRGLTTGQIPWKKYHSSTNFLVACSLKTTRHAIDGKGFMLATTYL